ILQCCIANSPNVPHQPIQWDHGDGVWYICRSTANLHTDSTTHTFTRRSWRRCRLLCHRSRPAGYLVSMLSNRYMDCTLRTLYLPAPAGEWDSTTTPPPPASSAQHLHNFGERIT